MDGSRATSGTDRKFRTKYIVLSVILLSILIFLLVYVLAGKLLESDDGEGTTSVEETSQTTEQFREDGMLSFLAPDGAVRSRITVEIAATPAAREAGLMGRQRMNEDRGMLFIFDASEERSFWMANTPLSLDIIYADAGKRIVTIQANTTPYSEASIPSLRPAQYVVEVNGGYCARNGIREGDGILWMESR